MLEGKTILLTGGTGSFGKKFTEIVLKKHNPHAIRIFSRDEFKQYQMEQAFQDGRLRFFIGDVRDRNGLYRAMNGVDIVVHTAAQKQVPICESNPFEAIKTNIIGAQNIIDAAIDNEVEKIVALSTDKAVNPVNLYGATKLCAEKLFIQGNTYVGPRKTKFSCTRYGNVVGSRGSVIPIFLEQKKKGKLTITDKRMTRFWITLEEGVNFVINSLERMKGGEIFVPKIPSTKITDLADVIAPEAKREIIGIRPGEKIHEVLLTENESHHSREFDNYFIIEPEFVFWRERKIQDGKPLPDGYRYSSDNNSQWLKKEEIKQMIKNLHLE